MPFEVNTRIDISFTEEQIREALLSMVTEKFPDIEVEALDFVIRRNPTNISARIVASLVGYNSPGSTSEIAEVEATKVEKVEATASMFDADPVVVEEEETDDADPVVVEEEETDDADPVVVEEEETDDADPVVVEEEETDEPEPVDAEAAGSKEGTVAAILDL